MTKAPTSQGRAGWLVSHEDPQLDWKVFCPNDLDRNGRRDHFLANSHLTYFGGAYVDELPFAFGAYENSCNDKYVNELGRAFGNGVFSGEIQKTTVGGWVRYHLKR